MKKNKYYVIFPCPLCGHSISIQMSQGKGVTVGKVSHDCPGYKLKDRKYEN